MSKERNNTERDPSGKGIRIIYVPLDFGRNGLEITFIHGTDNNGKRVLLFGVGDRCLGHDGLLDFACDAFDVDFEESGVNFDGGGHLDFNTLKITRSESYHYGPADEHCVEALTEYIENKRAQKQAARR